MIWGIYNRIMYHLKREVERNCYNQLSMVNLLIESCESLRLSSDHPKDKFQTKGMDTFLWGQLGDS